jgi:hypothetical protein
VLDVAERGDEDDRRLAEARQGAAIKLLAAEIGEPDVADDKVGAVLVERLERRAAGLEP